MSPVLSPPAFTSVFASWFRLAAPPNVARNGVRSSSGISPWLWEANEIELLRFVRAHNGNPDLVWNKVLTHAKWRVSEYGADTVVKENKFEHSMLNHEVFWWGENRQGCPTLIVRTRAHDGAYYDEDPRIFTR